MMENGNEPKLIMNGKIITPFINRYPTPIQVLYEECIAKYIKDIEHELNKRYKEDEKEC